MKCKQNANQDAKRGNIFSSLSNELGEQQEQREKRGKNTK